MQNLNWRCTTASFVLAVASLTQVHPTQSPVLAQSRIAETIEQRLLSAEPGALFEASVQSGNAARGAILFHGPLLGCAKCHSVSDIGADLLGPNLAKPASTEEAASLTNVTLVESILHPSKKVAPEYQLLRVLTLDGRNLSGLKIQGPADADAQELTLRDIETLRDIRIPREDIELQQASSQSIMPEGLMRALSNEAEFYDLIKYLVEIREGGPNRARELQPTSAQLAIQLPEYEANIDHAGMMRDWNEESFERGEKVYTGLCANCHGTLTAPGSLATALRFAEGKFKNGADPYSMYQTLTRGAGLMLPQTWMVPEQKYDVIHYLREQFLRAHNPSQYVDLSEEYLAGLPTGSERGPEPSAIEPWSQADYGPRLVNTYEIGRGGHNIAQKGIALQLDKSPGGVAHGHAWVVFDHDTMRVAGVWTSNDFIDWQGIHFNGRHGIHPHAVGDILLANPTGPGWAHPETGSLTDDARVLGRDGKWYGPLPASWSSYEGIYQVGRDSVIAYRVGDAEIREAFDWVDATQLAGIPASGLFSRRLQIGPREVPLELVVATLDDRAGRWLVSDDGRAVSQSSRGDSSARAPTTFDGQRYFEIEDIDGLDMYTRSFAVQAEITASGDGTIFSRAPKEGPWEPGGQSLFIRNGKLSYDVGWVGVIQSSVRVDDGQPHVVALCWNETTTLASLWVDGERVAKKKMRPRQRLENAVFRIGKTSNDFPSPSVLKSSAIASVRFFSRELQAADVASVNAAAPSAMWVIDQADASGKLVDSTGNGHTAHGVTAPETEAGRLVCGWKADSVGLQWAPRGRQLILRIPAGPEKLQATVWSSRAADDDELDMTRNFDSNNTIVKVEAMDIEPRAPVFPETMVTDVAMGGDQGGFAVDVLAVPTANPWQARVRTSGHDFFQDGDRMAVCTWDGDVWIVSGLSGLDHAEASPKLTWRRIAFGLFQPLGLKIIDGTIYLTCRDQLVRLDDRNQDGEIDYYHCVNNDHQVTEHFHEFAMGLQTDEQGNFYYAKSARHALTALVPHHGTLLRVTPDGSRTDILAKGFRAANGVCLNPDGSFIVTDQEGHWNPKNRINWVHEGGFYGNMYGYHDVTDASDAAMEQPLCWITNKFDRSPAELLWVDSPAWGPLAGSLLNLSYGYGKVYVVPHETVEGQVQGGMCQLPIADFPTGTMRGRFSPFDGQLYLCGLSAWATNQTMQEGGLYRVRYTGQPVALPVELSASQVGMRIGFSEPLGESTSLSPEDYAVEVWSLKRTKNYGSDHYDQHPLEITDVLLSEDRKSLTLIMPEISPTWCMELRLSVVTEDGRRVERIIHNTVHHLGPTASQRIPTLEP